MQNLQMDLSESTIAPYHFGSSWPRLVLISKNRNHVNTDNPSMKVS